ncbi:MAG: SufD family Fe-S cluster assembly protein [Cyanobium sp.]
MVAAPAAPAAAGAAAAWLAELAGAPLPGRRLEQWRFTDLSPLAAISPRLVDGAAQAPELRLPDGVEPLDAARAAETLDQVVKATGSATHWPVLLNRAAAARGGAGQLALRVRGAVGEPLVLARGLAGSGLEVRQLVLVLEPGASLELLQVVPAGTGVEGPAALCALTAVQLGEGASLRAGVLAQGQAGASLLAHWLAVQAPGSSLSLTSASSGWDLARVEPRVVQTAGAAHTQLRALQACTAHQISDTHSFVRFDGPEGSLDQLHKAVADGQGRSVFNGAVLVPRAAQRTNAAQLSRNLLLSDRARIDTKPELEIVADDVKCAHGATVSRLREDELFYLQSRGIAAHQAAALLKRAFCEEVLRELPAAAAGWNPLAHLLAQA